MKGGTSTVTSSHVKVIQRLVLYIQLLYPATKIHNFSSYIMKTDQVFWESKSKKHLRGNCSVISPGFNLPQRSWCFTAPWRTHGTPPLCSRINIFNSHFHSVWNLLVELKPQKKSKKQTNKKTTSRHGGVWWALACNFHTKLFTVQSWWALALLLMIHVCRVPVKKKAALLDVTLYV